MTNVAAHLRYLRIAPRKVRLVLDLIRGKSVDVAEEQLLALPKGASQPILKLIKSAQANAQHNFKLDPKTLFVRQAFADEGPKLKRYMPHAMGRATVILKRMSHVTIVLAPLSDRTGKSKTLKPAKSQSEPTATVQSEPKTAKTARRPAPVKKQAKPAVKDTKE